MEILDPYQKKLLNHEADFLKPSLQHADAFDAIENAIRETVFAPEGLCFNFAAVSKQIFFPAWFYKFRIGNTFWLFFVFCFFFLSVIGVSEWKMYRQKNQQVAPDPSSFLLEPVLVPIQEMVPLAKKEVFLEQEGLKRPQKNPVEGSFLWRFTFMTVTPFDMRLQVLNLLQSEFFFSLKDFLVQEVPGGVEIKFFLEEKRIYLLHAALSKLAPVLSPIMFSNKGKPAVEVPLVHGSEMVEKFSWYKVRSKSPLPKGKSAVLIWISQPR